MRFKLLESDIEILEAASGHTRTEILNHVASVIEEIVRVNNRYIKEERYGEKHFNNFRVSRSYKLAGRNRGIHLFYTLVRDSGGIRAFVSTKRSRWCTQNEYTVKDVYQNMIAEAMDGILMPKE